MYRDPACITNTEHVHTCTHVHIDIHTLCQKDYQYLQLTFTYILFTLANIHVQQLRTLYTIGKQRVTNSQVRQSNTFDGIYGTGLWRAT